MTHLAINTAVARACGYWFGTDEDNPEEHWHAPDGKPLRGTLPDYFNDLNACQVFLDVLRKRGRDDLDRYYRCLAEICYLQRPEPEFFSLVYIAHATAVQRAEAFLRTIGKWKEPAP